MFFLITSNAVVASYCEEDRFPDIQSNVQFIEDDLDEFKYDFATFKNQIYDLKNKLRENELSVDFKQNLSARNMDNEFFDENSLQNEVVIKYPLNWKQKDAKLNLLELQLAASEIRLEQKQHEQNLKKLELIVELYQSKILKELLIQEETYTKKLEQFYMERRISGEPSFENELEVKADLRRIADQQVANKINAQNIEEKLKIKQQKLPIIQSSGSSSPIRVTKIKLSDCNYTSFKLIITRLEQKIKEIEIKSNDTSNDFELDSSLSLSSSNGSNSSHTQDIAASITFSVPLYDGRTSRNINQNLIREKELLQLQINDLKASLPRELENRKNKELVFISSLRSISTDIKGLQKRLDELKQRQKLGQSTFLEENKTKLQIISLQESRLRIVSDFLRGWYQFLKDRKV